MLPINSYTNETTTKQTHSKQADNNAFRMLAALRRAHLRFGLRCALNARYRKANPFSESDDTVQRLRALMRLLYSCIVAFTSTELMHRIIVNQNQVFDVASRLIQTKKSRVWVQSSRMGCRRFILCLSSNH